MRSPEQVIQRLFDLEIVTEGDLLPCSAEDIAVLESRHGVALPESYKAYLRRMGRRVGDFFTADHFFADYERVLRKLGTKCAAEYEFLPAGAFVFATRMGDYYAYFVADGASDDPPIYGWDDDGEIKWQAKSFWDWFDRLIDDYAAIA
jgi:hypothetical protein